MKKSFVLFAFLLFGVLTTRALDANISYATFKSTSGNYLELYIHVLGNSAEFISVNDSMLQASLEVIVLFNSGGEIVKFDKYMLNSPVFAEVQDFIDLKRYILPDGDYTIEVSVNDVNRADNAKQYSQKFSMIYGEERVGQSDIQLLASIKPASEDMAGNPLVKSGYYLESLPSHFYDKYCERLIFYQEVYDADQFIDDNFLVSYYIEKIEGEQRSPPIGLTHKRKTPAKVVPMLQQVDITQLESGNYELSVEVRNRSGNLLSKKKVYFQRSNPYLNSSREEIAAGPNNLANEFVAKLDAQELRYALKAIAMQVDKTDGDLLNSIIKEKNLDAMRLYLFSFWAQENAAQPESAYEAYMEVARAIDQKFNSGFGYGFETDRGYVFMKYGAPNDALTIETDPNAPPYEIWFYNQFPQTNQQNVKFLFYNPSLSTNGFILLHSTARGEISNPRWEVELYRGTGEDPIDNGFIDGTRMQEGTGRYARRLFESF